MRGYATSPGTLFTVTPIDGETREVAGVVCTWRDGMYAATSQYGDAWLTVVGLETINGASVAFRYTERDELLVGVVGSGPTFEDAAADARMQLLAAVLARAVAS